MTEESADIGDIFCGSPNWNYPNTTIIKQWVRIVFYCSQGNKMV